MSKAQKRTGGCLCGAVRFSVDAESGDAGVCHCAMCRRWTGGPFLVLEGTSNLEIEDQSKLSVYASSDYGERCFCSTCGSVLFWRMRDGSHVAVSAGALDDMSDVKLGTEIFIDEKPDGYAFAGETKKFTGAEFIAQFADNAPQS